MDFTVEVERSLRVLDGAVTLLDSVAGVEPQTETVWRQADRYGVPRIIFANKMDRVGADFDRCLAMIRDRLTKKAYPLQLPVGSGEMFTGHIDVLRRVEFIFDDETLGKTFTEMPVPEAYRERVEAARHEVIEAAVEHDEELLEKYLGGAELTFEEIQRAIRKATTSGAIVPVLCGASFKNKGVQALLDAVIDYLPSPEDIPPIKGHLPLHDETHVERCASDDEPFSALAFKIATDPYVGRLTFFRVYSGSLKTRQLRLQQHQGQARARRPAAADARQQAGGDRGGARRRHRRGHRPQGHPHRRHAVRRGQADHPRGDEVPEPGHRRRHRAQDQGRPGQAGHRAAEAARRRIRPSGCAPTPRPARRSSPAWASCTSRSWSTG